MILPDDMQTYYEFNLSATNIKKALFSPLDNQVYIISNDNSYIIANFNDKLYQSLKASSCDPVDLKNNFLYSQ